MCDLSVIVVNWNGGELLTRCLATVPAAAGGYSHEILLVDNASRDGSPDLVRERFPAVRMLEPGRNLGFAAACNLAAAQARGEYLVLLNPDTACRPGSLAALAAFLDDRPRAGACGPVLLDQAGRPTLSWGTPPRLRYHLLSLLDPSRRWLPRRWREQTMARLPRPGVSAPYPVDYVVGACLAIRRSAWEAVGPLDERFFLYFEENDWCLRARRGGWGIWLVPAAEVVHLEGRCAAQASGFALRQFQHSLRLFVAKHQGRHVVPLYRFLLLLEYGEKALGRAAAALLRPGRGHGALARSYARIAALQLRSRIAPAPPA